MYTFLFPMVKNGIITWIMVHLPYKEVPKIFYSNAQAYIN